MQVWIGSDFRPTSSFEKLTDDMQRLAEARYVCRVSLCELNALTAEKFPSLAITRLLLIRSALALLGKSVRPDLEWPKKPKVRMGENDSSEFMGSILKINRLHEDPGARFAHYYNDYDLRARGVNVAEEEGFEEDPSKMISAPLFAGEPSAAWSRELQRCNEFISGGRTELVFWRDVMVGLQEGTFDNWELLSRVLTISEELWEAGPKAVADSIDEVKTKFEPFAPTLLAKNLQEKLKSNAPMLALMQAAGKENLSEARHRLHGDNGISSETREKLNECLDRLEDALDDFMLLLRLPANDPSFGARAKIWWRDFCRSNRSLTREYFSAENLSNATYPTALILTCTAVGSFLGQPLAGSVVGGLIAQQMKPSQAAKELGKPQDASPD